MTSSTYTIWQFTSPSTGKVTKSIRSAEPNDYQVQHEYQKVLWRGDAHSEQGAWCAWRKSEHSTQTKYTVQVRAIKHLTAEITIEAGGVEQARTAAERLIELGLVWDESDAEDQTIESVQVAQEQG